MVTIFATPTAQEYTLVGVSAVSSDAIVPGSHFSSISAEAADQPRIRYVSDGYYEFALPGGGYKPLVPSTFILEPTPGGAYFEQEGDNTSVVTISSARAEGYVASEIINWSKITSTTTGAFRSGFAAIGIPTNPANVPITGSATYNGIVRGISDRVVIGWDDYVYAPITGTVRLDLDFAGGALGGSMDLNIDSSTGEQPLGRYSFKDTVYSTGSSSYSGAFVTDGTGLNFFDGRFTGAAGKETIARWALPFTLGGTNYQGLGAWIAKQ